MANVHAWADSADDDYSRLARVAYMEGPVSFQGAGDVDWSAAAVNFPLQPGDRLYTGLKGRAEIEFDDGSVLRLAEGTDIQILSLREDLIQIRILTGLSSLMVSSNLEFEVDTPAAAFVMLREGSYRFEADDGGDTSAIVRKGEMEAISHRFVRRVRAGDRILVTADPNSTYQFSSHYGRDAWDEWNDRRNVDRIVHGSRQYVPDSVYVGVSDLDRHGRWVTVESYGAAWIPFSVGVSWSPYTVGRWCYRPVWGWTWVSYESWGWLPYHYGRWYRSANYGWCWLPGPSFSFDFWSPGLVTFYHGPSWVSWCPLGPGDYYSINNYYYNARVHRHRLGDLRKLHSRPAGDPFNRHVRDAFRTVHLDHFRDGRSRAVATDQGYARIEKPWERGTLVRERLAVEPTKMSFNPDPGRQVVRSKVVNPKPAVVYSSPNTRVNRSDAYVRIRDSEITAQAGRSIAHARSTAPSAGGRAPGSARAGVRDDAGQTVRSPVQKNPDARGAEERAGRATDSPDARSPRADIRREPGNPAGNRPQSQPASEMPSRDSRDRDSARSRPETPARQSVERPTTERAVAPQYQPASEMPSRDGRDRDSTRSRPEIPSRQYIDRPTTQRAVDSRDSSNGSSGSGLNRPAIPSGRDAGPTQREGVGGVRSYARPAAPSYSIVRPPTASSRSRVATPPASSGGIRSDRSPASGRGSRSAARPSAPSRGSSPGEPDSARKAVKRGK